MAEIGSGAVGLGPTPAAEPTDYGVFQWVKWSQIPEYEAAGWKVSACVSRFHFDSYLMFLPAGTTTSDAPNPTHP